MNPQLFTGCILALGVVLGLAGLLVVVSHGLEAIRHARGRSRQHALDMQLLHREIEAEHKRIPRWVPLEPGWQGYRRFEVDRVVRECNNVTSLYLVPQDRKALPHYNPGQFLTFGFRIPGRNDRTIRCYSLSDRPRGDRYRISVKRLGPPPKQPDAPPGLSSSFVNEQLRPGDLLDVRAPGGDFFLDVSSDSPVVLLGGGIGITPLLSMLTEIAESGCKRETWLFYGVTNSDDHAMKRELEALAAENDNVHVRISYADPKPSDVHGRDYHESGFLSLDLIRKTLPANNYDFYLCGPPMMMTTLTRALDEWGVPSDRVHFESFGPASVAKPAAAGEPLDGAETPCVEFARSGRSETWNPRCGSLLEFAESLGIPLSSGCRSGNCGACETPLKRGKVHYARPPAHRAERGACLPCACVPDGPIVLDA